MDSPVRFESLDTSFVNLSALIRYLHQRKFVGRVRVALEEYEANVFLHGADSPKVLESDHSTGRDAQGKEAMERLLVRARESGGIITVYQNADEAKPAEVEVQQSSAPRMTQDQRFFEPLGDDVNWEELLRTSGELIAAVEHAVVSTGENFADHFRVARIEIGDDYPFIDPTSGSFKYESSSVQLRERPAARAYVSSLTECLRRVVDKLAAGKYGTRFRERVAVELAVTARKKENSLAEFTPQLDKIAGTRVL